MRRNFSSRVLAISIGIFIAISTIYLIYYPSDATQTLLLGLTLAFLTLLIIIKRVLKYGLSDPIFIFLSFFMFYYPLTLIDLASLVKNGFLSIDLYPTFFSIEVLKYSGLLGMMALFGLIVGTSIYNFLFRYRRNFKLTLRNSDLRFLLFFGFVFYLLGIAMFFISYQQIGGFFESLSISRLVRFQMLSSAHSLPYLGFILLGISLFFSRRFFARVRGFLF